jgi:outer membrane protein assembly factor BamB
MVAAVDANSGQPRWRYCAESAGFLDVVSATDRIVYAVLGSASTSTGLAADRLVAFDVGDGSMLWTIEIPVLNDGVEMDALQAPGAFAGSGVIVLDILDGNVVWHIGYDASTGEEVWRVAGAENSVIANTDDLAVVADLYLGEGIGPEIKLVALDRRTGRGVGGSITVSQTSPGWPRSVTCWSSGSRPFPTLARLGS